MTDDPVLDAVGGAGPPADAAGGGIETVPGWLAALAAISWRLLAVLGLGLILLSIALVLATVTASVLVAFLVSASFAPLNQRLRDRGWSRTPAASATSVVALLTVLGVALILAVGFAPVAAALIRLAEDGFEELAAELQRMGVSPTAVTFVVSFFENLEAWLLAAVGGIVDRLGDMTTVLILGGFLTFFTLQDGDRAWGDIARSLTGPFYGKVTDRARVALLQVGSLLPGRCSC
jgi:predicted PurR-regulated permease PerM